ncbi:MAG: hypothetical protein MK212_04950 [Saprospiraceae bacterium]|nr:hypothetical protein [Saprospiraceae bacterium]
MSKLFLVLSISALFILIFGCNNKVVVETNHWANEIPSINGKLNDWHNLQRSAKQNAFQYEISNDQENLYIGFRVIDPSVQTNIMRRGLTIWFDTLGKKKRHVGIGYPLALSESDAEKIAVQANGDANKMSEVYTEFAQEFDLLGYTDEALRVSNLTSKDMKVGAGFDKLRSLVCEIKIPLKRIFKTQPSLDKVFSINFKVNEEKRTAEDEPSLFDDPSSNSITQSNPLMQSPNRMGQPGQQLPQNNPNSPLTGRSQSTSVWVVQQLTSE